MNVKLRKRVSLLRKVIRFGSYLSDKAIDIGNMGGNLQF